MVMVLLAQVALTPAGKSFAPETPLLEIPVASEVKWVIFVMAELIQIVGVDEAAAAVLVGVTVIVAVAL
jgi:hypothetical protein